MADRRGIVVPLLIIAFIFLSPEPARGPAAAQFDWQRRFDDNIAHQRQALSELRNASFSDSRFHFRKDAKDGGYGLNFTGLEPERGYAWDALNPVLGRAQQQLYYASAGWGAEALELEARPGDDVVPPLYANVTGFVHGQWVRSTFPVDPPALNLSAYAPESPFGPRFSPFPFGRNITANAGDVRIRFRQDPASTLLDAETAGNVTTIDIDLTLSDSDSSEEHELRLYGVYFPAAGRAMLTTTSDKFAGIFMLPHLAHSRRMFDMSRAQLNQTLSRVIARQENYEIERFNPWSSTPEGAAEPPFPSPECELVVYLQQMPPSPRTRRPSSTSLAFLEQELRFPTGAFVPATPPLRFAMVAFSPDCGYMLESKGPPEHARTEGEHLVGLKLEAQYTGSRRHLIVFNIALALQLLLLMRQMHEASTPSTRSKISLYTMAMLALGDGFTTMTFMLLSLFISGLWVNLMETAFFAFISVSFFGMRFLLDIWAVQAPERARRQREEAEEERRQSERMQAALQRVREAQEGSAENVATTGDNTPPDERSNSDGGGESQPTVGRPPTVAPLADATEVSNSTTASLPAPEQPVPGSLPLPVVAQRPTDTGATPVFMPSDQEGLEPAVPTGAAGTTVATSNGPSFGSLYTRFYLLLLGTLFLSLNATSWPSAARRVYFTTLALLYLSFWLPQIYRNVRRNCRHALNWEFVAGQSVLRLLPFAYFYGYASNVIFAPVDLASLALLVAWVWIQLVLLVSQEIIGPRWFIREHWAPPAYDYHPVLRDDGDEEHGSTMPIGFSQATAPASSADKEKEKKEDAEERVRRGSAGGGGGKGTRVFDCAICMQDLEVPVVVSGSPTDAANLLARRAYMVTPCRHIFHSTCLEGWMKFRLQCPICRETLPPL